ncbi:MAG: hypothetical protein JNK04_11610, partial [Myxococcales bacterium]|nr:hypothetical protein [Myxococcales bacterium]
MPRLETRRDALLCLALGVLGCSGSETKPRGPDEVAISHRLHPNEVLPGDLDLVVRIDIERVKVALGPSAEKELGARFGTDGMLGKAVQKARTVTVALRVADIDGGDHVIVVEGDVKGFDPSAAGFAERQSTNDMVRIFSNDEVRGRDSTHTIVVLDERAVAFVSPVEADAVMRVLREGPDDLRGQPVAEGIVSADIRPRRLSPSLERKFPSISRLIAQVTRIKARLSVADAGLLLEGEIITQGEPGADRVVKFFKTLQEGAGSDGPSAVLKTASFERFGVVVNVRAEIPVEVLLGLVARDEKREP